VFDQSSLADLRAIAITSGRPAKVTVRLPERHKSATDEKQDHVPAQASCLDKVLHNLVLRSNSEA
jgi:hypothetical protein